MNEKTISIESSDFTNFEKTLIITDGKIETRASKLDSPYNKTVRQITPHDRTVRNISRLDLSEVEYRNLRMSQSEKKQYERAVHRGNKESKYKFQGNLISGGMGAILEVIDQDLNRPTAMKVIKPSFKNDERSLIEFIREAKITAMLEHPNIIPVHELGLSDETGLYFTMKLIEGESLNHILYEIRNGNVDYVEKYNMYSLLNIFRKICDAVDFAHSKNIIHQDIKPHNVIVGRYGEVLLMDWGLARYIGDPDKEVDRTKRDILKNVSVLTDKGKNIIQGSPAYMSPEQAGGDISQVDKKTDIFLLAAMLYHILTLEAPYTGENLKDVLRKAKQCDLIDPQKRNPDRHIPDELCRIVKKASSLRKEDRHDNVQRLINDIDDVIAGRWLKQEKKIFTSGQFLMKEGDDAEEAYLITKGKVQVFRQVDRDDKVVLGTLTEGDTVGEMALITDDLRSASVVALEDTEVAVLTRDILSRSLKNLPPYAEKMVKTLTRRLQTANAIIHPHLAADCSPFVLQHMCLVLKDIATIKREFVVSLNKICSRISIDLGLPVSKVKKVLENAAKENLVTIQEEQIIVDDINRIMHIADLAKFLISK
jgi:serine/threonine-protein kinase